MARALTLVGAARAASFLSAWRCSKHAHLAYFTATTVRVGGFMHGVKNAGAFYGAQLVLPAMVEAGRDGCHHAHDLVRMNLERIPLEGCYFLAWFSGGASSASTSSMRRRRAILAISPSATSISSSREFFRRSLAFCRSPPPVQYS